MPGCHDRSFFAASGSFRRTLKLAAGIVPGEPQFSACPMGTPPVRASSAALFDGHFEHSTCERPDDHKSPRIQRTKSRDYQS
jgi:hypothetical protein